MISSLEYFRQKHQLSKLHDKQHQQLKKATALSLISNALLSFEFRDLVCKDGSQTNGTCAFHHRLLHLDQSQNRQSYVLFAEITEQRRYNALVFTWLSGSLSEACDSKVKWSFR